MLQSVSQWYIWPVWHSVAFRVTSRDEAPDWIMCFRLKTHLWVARRRPDRIWIWGPQVFPNQLFHRNHSDTIPLAPPGSPFQSQLICQHPAGVTPSFLSLEPHTSDTAGLQPPSGARPEEPRCLISICSQLNQMTDRRTRKTTPTVPMISRDVVWLRHFIFVPNIHWVETTRFQNKKNNKIKRCTGYWGSTCARETETNGRDCESVVARCHFFQVRTERRPSGPANCGSTRETRPQVPTFPAWRAPWARTQRTPHSPCWVLNGCASSCRC